VTSRKLTLASILDSRAGVWLWKFQAIPLKSISFHVQRIAGQTNLANLKRRLLLGLSPSGHLSRVEMKPNRSFLQEAEHDATNGEITWKSFMRVKLLIGIAVPLVFASAPAMAFGLLGLIGSVAGLAVGAAGGAALSSGGVGPAGQSGATAFSPAPGGAAPSRTAWAATGSAGEFTSLMPSGSRGVPHTAVRVRHFGWVQGSPDVLNGLARPLQGRPGVDQRTVRSCRDALARTVAIHGAVQVEAVSAGRTSRRSSATLAPLKARVIYRLPTGFEVKQASVTCHTTRASVVLSE
jgi:hypothetical protein